MAWSQLSINKPHLVYIILGGFTSIFMLVSLFIKEKLYIGEATVATICGVIFGPHGANLINPLTWGNTDQITLEFSRIVLVVQCFAVGVELPKSYMERHWRSVTFLLVPVMTFGWLITSLFVWWMVPDLSWLESLVTAACVTATDPVLASSVVGKGKFAKRVPKHLRDILSAESGCNDGMAFPFIYLALYLVRYDLHAHEVVEHWFLVTILYECIFGCFFGVAVGYIARRMIKLTESKGIIDRESFLVFYFVLALFCAGAGSMLGLDDLLVGFAAGVGFSNDGWFSEKTEESHVSNVIDLLLNLAYFVYFGTIIPWDQYNSHEHGLYAWRLAVMAILVILFRRIPIMLACKPFIPDIKTWREALFAGHFGPIGVGAIFVAILARAELETDSTVPLAQLPDPGTPDYNLIYCVWPVVTFMVIASILVHGSSIAVFTLGKRINTLTITLSYTQDNANGPAWMNRLPRLAASNSRSLPKLDSSDSIDEKDIEMGVDQTGPVAVPTLLLRRQKEGEEDEKGGSQSSSRRSSRTRRRSKKRRTRDSRYGAGGPVSDSAIRPAPRDTTHSHGPETPIERTGDQFAEEFNETISRDASLDRGRRHSTRGDGGEGGRRRSRSASDSVEVEAYEEGDDMIVEDKEGTVVDKFDISKATPEQKAHRIEEARDKIRNDNTGKYARNKHHPHERNEGEEIQQNLEQAAENPKNSFMNWKHWTGFDKAAGSTSQRKPSTAPERKRGPAHAYQFGNTIIVEDEDGEVIKKYTLPGNEQSGDSWKWTLNEAQMKSGIRKMSTWVGMGNKPSTSGAELTGVKTNNSVDAQPSGSKSQNTTIDLVKFLESQGRKRAQDGDDDNNNNNNNNNNDDDDGLRMVISRADQYGLTGLHKNSTAPGTGRRLSTRDFLQEMQQMDHKQRVRHVDDTDAPEGVKDEMREAVKDDGAMKRWFERPLASRTGASTAQTGGPVLQRPEMAARAQSDLVRRPQTKRANTSESVKSVKEQPEEEEEEREIPTHDLQSTLLRRTAGQNTAAAQRRTRLTAIKSMDEEEEDDPNGTNEPETAAEKRRRLAALGRSDDNDGNDRGETAVEKRRRLAALGKTGGGDNSDSSDSDSDSGPSDRQAREGGGDSNSAATASRPRIQWGGESGREGGKGTAWGGSKKAPGLQKPKKKKKPT